MAMPLAGRLLMAAALTRILGDFLILLPLLSAKVRWPIVIKSGVNII